MFHFSTVCTMAPSPSLTRPLFTIFFQGAWSKSDPEKGIGSAEDEEKEKKRKALQVRAHHMFSRIL